jgi:hypothetical protein
MERVRSRRRAWSIAFAIVSSGCSAASVAPTGPVPSASASAPPVVDAGVAVRAGPDSPGHLPLITPNEVALDFTLAPLAGRKLALAVHARADRASSWARWIDDKGAMGPAVRFAGELPEGAFALQTGSIAVLSGDGARTCWSVFERGAATPTSRACVPVRPVMAVELGDRVALFDVDVKRPVTPHVAAPKPAKPAKKPREKAAKPGAAKGKSKPSGKAAAKPAKPSIDVLVRFASSDGKVEETAVATGIHFVAPIDGMALVDAKPRAGLADLLWYEQAPGRKTRAPLGSGRLVAGTLRADGRLDSTSVTPLVDADLDYGMLQDHRAPRLFGDATSMWLVDLDKNAQCEAIRVRPSRGVMQPIDRALCAVAPEEIGSADADRRARFTTFYGAQPARAFGQGAHDPARAAWAGERAYFVTTPGSLRSFDATTGALRDEPAPFAAKRATLAWSSVLGDEAVAVSGDRLVRAARDGALTRTELTGYARDAGAGAARALDAELASDRRRAAKIGDAIWIARGDLVQLAPKLAAPKDLARKAPIDASALVGGADHGLLIALASSTLSTSLLAPDGAIQGRVDAPSPVRAGFDATERHAGGAIVAGAASSDATRVVAFTIDAKGRPSAPRATALKLAPSDLGVRVTALPNGGALLTDLARTHVTWLDDEAHPIADADWPLETSAADCIDGRPARVVVPSQTPGHFVRIEDFAAKGTCISGEAVWGAGDVLRWIGTIVEGLSSTPTLGFARDASPCPTSSMATSDNDAPPATKPARCSPDMVLVKGNYCIDRFEDALFDATTGLPISPDFSPLPKAFEIALGEWSTARERAGDLYARAFPLPFVPVWQRGVAVAPVAVPRYGARPNGYVSGELADAACQAAGKRLCSLDEFVTACRGERDTDFPYGDDWEDGACNVFREDHPAAALHDNASTGHLDPRLNYVRAKGKPLFHAAGETPRCKSTWGDDAVYDLVGNLDEWVDRGGGSMAFAGGFYARATRSGCDALVASHPKAYFDYSTGVRCCSAAASQ